MIMVSGILSYFVGEKVEMLYVMYSAVTFQGQCKGQRKKVAEKGQCCFLYSVSYLSQAHFLWEGYGSRFVCL